MSLKRYTRLYLFLNILVMMFSPWWWIITQRNLLAGIFISILSISVFIYFWLGSGKLLGLILVLVAAVFLINIKNEGFDQFIIKKSALDTQQYFRRHEFLAKELGKIYTNRFSLAVFQDYSLIFSKVQRNFFANLDPNLYFFASHPRERIGVEEFEKYQLIFLPFFLIGLLYSIFILSRFLIFVFLIILLSSILSPKFYLGPILFFPLITYLISIGIILSLKLSFRYLKK